MNYNNTAFEFWFGNLDVISSGDKYLLKSKIGKAFNIYSEDAKYLKKLLKEEKANKLIQTINTTTVEEIEQDWENAKNKDVHFVTRFDKEYPNQLNNICSSPYILNYYGNLMSNKVPSVAIIGARNCSDYGREMATIIASKLAQNGFNIVSGMAKGIDSIAQLSALESNGYSIGILGCGIDVCYPKESKDLYDMLKTKGCIMSEYKIDMMPLKNNFPSRNRIISGLSDIVIVIEAKQKSGSLITVDRALEQGRDVYVVPGRVGDVLSKGCNNLILQGADIICDIDEFIEMLTFKYISSDYYIDEKELSDDRVVSIETKVAAKMPKLDEIYMSVYEHLDCYPLSLTEIAKRSDKNESELIELLMELEFKGVIEEVSKGYYKKTLILK